VTDLTNKSDVLDRIDRHLVQAQVNAGLWKEIFENLVRFAQLRQILVCNKIFEMKFSKIVCPNILNKFSKMFKKYCSIEIFEFQIESLKT
jgi:hypothetical protein